MKSIERRYKLMKQRHPDKADYIQFARAVKYQHYSKRCISKWFGKLICKDEYSPSDRRCIISHLKYLSDYPEESTKLPDFARSGTIHPSREPISA